MNQYDANDRVSRQVLPDGGTYQFAYSVNGQGQKVTEVTNPRGYLTRTIFNASGYEHDRSGRDDGRAHDDDES